jgi:hypothetical protein
MPTRRNLLFGPPPSRRNSILKVSKGLTRREALVKLIGPFPWVVTKYKDTKGRPFYLTMKGTFVVRSNGKSLYGRKSSSCNVPEKIRPRRCAKINSAKK